MKDAWTHGGGVVYRMRAGRPEILIVRASRPPHEWLLPKGHIDPGETPEECARREVGEEAGVASEPVAFIAADQFTTPRGESVMAAFFLLRYVRDIGGSEDRERQWVTCEEARTLIPFDGARDIVRAAETLIPQDASS
jgi:ADP-ribose pyrophosphatase YjhB (NUDIX family)